jgi:hypothetical protein
MSTKYTQITDGRRARVHGGYLYVMQTNLYQGMLLEQGGYADRVYRMPYAGTVISSQVPNEHGITDIDRCVESGEVIRRGRLIR